MTCSVWDPIRALRSARQMPKPLAVPAATVCAASSYTLNKGIAKSSIYAGWREMDEYMRENKLEGVRPEIQPAPPAAPAAPSEEIIQEPKAKAKKG